MNTPTITINITVDYMGDDATFSDAEAFAEYVENNITVPVWRVRATENVFEPLIAGGNAEEYEAARVELDQLWNFWLASL